MTELQVRTKGGASPTNKPRIYFTCHPEDFHRFFGKEQCFDKICEDIFRTHDCAIYYTANMAEEIPENILQNDIYSANLFVIPVTFRLLTTPNRAMDCDIAFAQRENIPILPLMMEHGIDEFYSLPNKFGERQYLSPFSSDLTEISYEQKLKKHLQSILISDEMAKQVRDAFDAYIFLSYRKVDRFHANNLMRQIHARPEFRDIAIWYDEFLIPGESFKENIDRMLRNSHLFALLVTPNLLNPRDNGEPNYVQAHEYPAARTRSEKMPILPVEMEKTNKTELGEKFSGIPECVDPKQDEAFCQRLVQSLQQTAYAASDSNPKHNFLIGLAYLDGIDVEVNRDRGVELIKNAAEAGLPEAMGMLVEMYTEGMSVSLDYREAVKWAEKLVVVLYKAQGEEDPETLAAMGNLALLYSYLGDYCKSVVWNEKVYAIRMRVLGPEHPDTIVSINNLAAAYGNIQEYEKAAELGEAAYIYQCSVSGAEQAESLLILSNLAVAYDRLGAWEKALALSEKSYELHCRVLGEKNPDTLNTLNNLSVVYGHLGNLRKAAKLNETAYILLRDTLGQEHPDTLTSLCNLGSIYNDLKEFRKAASLLQTAYDLLCRILGENHPNTLTSLSSLIQAHTHISSDETVLMYTNKLYEGLCQNRGECHHETLKTLEILLALHRRLGNKHKADQLKRILRLRQYSAKQK